MKLFTCVCIQKHDDEDDSLNQVHVLDEKRRQIPRLELRGDICNKLNDIWPEDAETRTHEKWIEWCHENKQVLGDPAPIFMDKAFPPLDKSITDRKLQEKHKDIVFLHYHEIYGNTVCVFNTIEPSDIVQGDLGDCWFLSSLASLAERPEIIRNLFLTTEINNEGVYQTQICRHGLWETFTLDGYFPCQHNSPVFTKTKDAELWVLLLEKTYAKRFGSYYNLEVGHPEHALVDLTGCPARKINLTPKNEYDMNRDEIWQFLCNLENENEMVIVTVNDLANKVGNLNKPMSVDDTGLIDDHCYSVLDVKNIRGYKLLQIRNPWARKEWNGDFGDKSDLWDDELKALCGWKDADDGIFWMQWHDFTSLFNTLDVCYCPQKIGDDLSTTFQNIRLPFQLYKLDEKDSHPLHFTCSNIQVRENSTLAWIGLHQPDIREVGVHSYCDVHAIILKDEDGLDPDSLKPIKLLSCIGRNKFFQVDLTEGIYEIICFTSGRNYSQDEHSHQATLTLHYLSDKELDNECFTNNVTRTREETVLDHLKKYTKSYGEKSQFAVTFNFSDGTQVPSYVSTMVIKPCGNSDNQLFVWLCKIEDVDGYKVTYKATYKLYLDNMITFNHFKPVPDKIETPWIEENLTNGKELLVSIACKNMNSNIDKFSWRYTTNVSGNINQC